MLNKKLILILPIAIITIFAASLINEISNHSDFTEEVNTLEGITQLKYKEENVKTFKQYDIQQLIQNNQTLPTMAANDIIEFVIPATIVYTLREYMPKYRIPAKYFLDEQNNFDKNEFERFEFLIQYMKNIHRLEMKVDENQNNVFIQYSPLFSIEDEAVIVLDVFAHVNNEKPDMPLSPLQLRQYKAMAAEIHDIDSTFFYSFNYFYQNIQNLITLNFQHFTNQVDFDINLAPAVLAFFDTALYLDKFKSNYIVNDYFNKYDVDALFDKYNTHYQTIKSLDLQLAIDKFKVENHQELPNNKNEDICFVRIPKDVTPNFSVIGSITFDYTTYDIDAYNCSID